MNDAASRTITPHHYTVAKLLSAQHTLEAPRYQRNFAWGPEEVGAFLHDLDTCLKARMAAEPVLKHHFFGSLVTVLAPVPGSGRTNLEVIDGQQRLATFAMLINQLKYKLSALAAELGGDDPLRPVVQTRAENLARDYEVYVDEIELQNIDVPRIKLSAPDQPFFSRLLKRDAVEETRRSHSLLAAGYRQIGDYLDAILARAEDHQQQAALLQSVHDVLKAEWTIVHMAATAKADAYMFFQVLNDRGVGLTEGELLRSTTLEALHEVAAVETLNQIEDAWNAMLGGDAQPVRHALNAIYSSHVGGVPGRSVQLPEYVGAFFPILLGDARLDPRGARTLVDHVTALRGDFERIQDMLAGEWPLAGPNAISIWKRNRLRLLIVHLQYFDALPLLVAACQLPASTFADLVMLLERFAFRYHSVGEGPRDKAREALNRHAVEIRRDPDAYKPASLKIDLADLFDAYVPDESFRRAVSQIRYSRDRTTNKPLKYLFLTLEDYARWYAANPQGEPVCRDESRVLDFETSTIEHVYAESAREKDESLDPLLDTLGNLTALSSRENDAAGSKTFAEKKRYFEESTSWLNQEIAKENAWTADVVERRTAELADMALRVFSFARPRA